MEKNLLTIRTQFKQPNINSEKQNVIPILFTIAKCEKSNRYKYTHTNIHSNKTKQRHVAGNLQIYQNNNHKIESNRKRFVA